MTKQVFGPISGVAVENKIYIIRGKKVMLDKELAELYGVRTKELNKAVARNRDRFPADFMFKLSKDEAEILRFQIGTSRWGGQRYLPHAFTEHGILMLSSVLNSRRAIQVNIQIMRTFTKLREMISSNELIRQKIEELEQKYEKHDKQFKIVFEAIRELLETPAPKPKRSIGFHAI